MRRIEASLSGMCDLRPAVKREWRSIAVELAAKDMILGSSETDPCECHGI